uniref:Vitellogenin domain-containing protein n=1 Tax=Amphimedon queenslandica TaxID=400682 RepID=A0A1X7TR05_AMPQE
MAFGVDVIILCSNKSSIIPVILLLLLLVNRPTLSSKDCDWSVGFDDYTAEGDALLNFKLAPTENGHKDIIAMLTCEDILVRGTGQLYIRLHKFVESVAQFNVSLPMPQNMKDFVLEDNWMNHVCSFVTKPRHNTASSESSVCKVHIKSLVGRFIPTCEEEREDVILHKTEVNKELNQVYLYLKNSPLDVITFYTYCAGNNYVNYNKTNELEINRYPLTPNHLRSSTVSVGFMPDCK